MKLKKIRGFAYICQWLLSGDAMAIALKGQDNFRHVVLWCVIGLFLYLTDSTDC